ncbi:ribonuclease H-like domain-containing protein [Tanacetum coccineum]|uniref:Ribonuclease H-like domain-containing protein n=1 Tax=Tanacetum coccineum TaxID=301880 RepID=A0ABQ5E760_9ASTR
MAGSDDENLPPPPPPQTPTQQAPHTVSTIKLSILKKGEYDIWAMKMEHYLSHTDYHIWEVIQKVNGPVSVLTDTNGVIKDAIKSKFDGNDESKKMQKYILKQQFEGFLVSNSEGLHKGYDMFHSLLSQLEIHGAGISTEDANQKFLRSLPSSWSQVSLVMKTKPGVDSLSFDDLYNNLRVFESDVKGSTGSYSSAQNAAFVSSESTSSTNDVSTAYDLEQLDEFDLEEMDLKWQVAMISMRLKKFYKKIGKRLQFDAKEPVGFDKTKVECFNCHKIGHFARECRSKGNQESRRRDAGNTGYRAKDNGRRPGKHEEPKALVTLNGEGVDWIGHAEDEQENFALMVYSNSGSDTELTSCSKECVESYAKLKKLYDEQREQLGDASIEIQAYTQALKKVEAQLVAHQKNQLWYEEKIRFMKIDLDDKTDVLTYHKKLLAEAVKEKEELKTKLENFQSSSKNLSKLLNSQMSAKDKSGLGYGDQVHEGVLSYENEVFQSVFDSRSSDVEDSPVHDRFANIEGMHAVPPLMIGNYMPPGPDREVDDSMFTYGPKQSKTSESDTQTSNFDSCESNSSVETLEYVPEPVVVEPKVVSQPKVWSDAPIIEEYESDSDDEYHVKTPRESVKEQNTYSPSPKADKRDWNGLMSKRLGLGYGFTKKACFVCGSFSHLIRDCDFHEKRMAKQVELNKKKGKGTGQGENRPVWNNVQRLNHQNKFVPKAVLTKTGIFPVNTARQNLSSQAATTSTARKVNTARPIVNEIRPRNNFYKSHSPIRRPFNRTTTPKANFSNQKVNTAEVKAVSAVGGKRETAVKPSAGCNWRPKRHYWNKDNPQRALKNKGIVDSGCSRHMTGNKAYLVEYQDYNGGPVAFGGSKGYITGKAVRSENQANKTAGPEEANHSAGTQDNIDAGNSEMEADPAQDYFVLPICSSYTSTVKSSEAKNEGEKPNKDTAEALRKEFAQDAEDLLLQEGAARATCTNTVNTVRTPVSTASSSGRPSYPDLTNYADQDDSRIPALEDIYGNPNDGIFTNASYDDDGAMADFTNLETTVNVNAMQEELMQFKIQKVWILVDLPYRKKAIRTKWVYRNKKDERGVMVTNKARLVAQGYRQEEGIDYDKMDVDSAFLYGTIDEEVSVKTACTPIETHKPLVKDEEAADVDVHLYRSMIGSLMYLTASRPDILYLKGKPKLDLWYPRESSFDLVAYSDNDYGGANLDRKSTTGVCFAAPKLPVDQDLVDTEPDAGLWFALVRGGKEDNPTIYASFVKQFWTTATASTNVTGEIELTASIDGQAKTIIEESLRRHLKLEDNGGITSLPNTEIFEQLALMEYATDSDKLNNFQKETTPTAEEPALMPHESPLQSVHSLGHDEGSVSLNELMALLIKRVKKLEKQVKTGKVRRRTKIVLSEDEAVEEDSSKQGRSLIEELDLDADFSLVPPHDAEIQENISDDTEVLLEEEMTTELIKEPTELVEDQGSGENGNKRLLLLILHLILPVYHLVLLVQLLRLVLLTNRLVRYKDVKKKKDKGKAIVIEDESVQKKSKKQVQEERLGYEEAIRLQEQIDEEEKKKGLQEMAKIAKQLYHALQNRPRSVAEVRKNMMVYLKNQGGYKMKDFKGMSYDDIRLIFKKVWDQIHSFVPMDFEEEVQRLKRAGQDVGAKPAKRQITEEVSESVQEQTDEEPKSDELSHEQLNQMEVHSEDTMQFWKINQVAITEVQERYNSSGLTKDKEMELWVELKMLFEPNAKNLFELQKYMYDPLKWWLYDMCAVHHVSTKKGQYIFMLVEKDYPLTKGLATLMLSNKLRVDQQSEIAFELLTKIYNIANKPRK